MNGALNSKTYTNIPAILVGLLITGVIVYRNPLFLADLLALNAGNFWTEVSNGLHKYLVCVILWTFGSDEVIVGCQRPFKNLQKVCNA